MNADERMQRFLDISERWDAVMGGKRVFADTFTIEDIDFMAKEQGRLMDEIVRLRAALEAGSGTR